MLDDARSVWELIERRVAATPDRVMLYDGDRATTFARVPRRWSSAPPPGCTALGVGADVNVSWQLPTWTESAVLVGALCRLGAVQNPMLPIYRYREVSFIAKQTRLQAADHAVGVEQLRLRRARRAGRGRERRHAHARRRPLEPRRRPGDAAARAAAFDDPAARSGALDLLHVGHHRRAEGRAAHRPLGARRRDRLRGEDARRSTTTSRSSRSRSRTSAGSSSACSRRCSPARPRCSWRRGPPPASTELIRKHGVTLGNGAPAIHAALHRRGARPTPTRTRRCATSRAADRRKPPQLHDELKDGGAASDRHDRRATA